METQQQESPPLPSFEEVVQANKDRILRICSIYARPPIEPQDLFQEVLIQTWRSFDNFKGQSSVNTWMYRVALNVCMSSGHKLDKKNKYNIRLESIQFIPAVKEPDEAEALRYQYLRECIAILEEADRSFVIMYLDELSYKEIAYVTGISENHVAVKMKRIRKKLLTCITKKLT